MRPPTAPPQRDLFPAEVENAAISSRLEAVDNPEVSQGVVLFDYSHNNALFVEELNVLFSKLVARGYSYEIIDSAEVRQMMIKNLSETVKICLITYSPPTSRGLFG